MLMSVMLGGRDMRVLSVCYVRLCLLYWFLFWALIVSTVVVCV